MEPSSRTSAGHDEPAGYRADVAVIVIGGNDVTHRIRTTVSQRHLAQAIQALQQQGTKVVVGELPQPWGPHRHP